MGLDLEKMSKEFTVLSEEKVRDCKSSDPQEYIKFFALREKLISEEHNEFLSATNDILTSLRANQCPTDNMLKEYLDALIDMVYLAAGTAEILGMNFEEGFKRVHESNMSKVNPATGKFDLSDGTDGFPKGKVLKGAGYKKVDLSGLFKLIMVKRQHDSFK